jgi:acyl-CoA synthetase (AMP-forming)/AMP-acid ligase II
VVGHRVIVNLADTTFFAPDTAGKITEVINGERYIRVAGFADRLGRILLLFVLYWTRFSPAVRDDAVVGVPDRDLGERVVSLVHLAESARSVNPDEILALSLSAESCLWQI